MRPERSLEASLYLLRMRIEKGYRHPDQDFISRIKSLGGGRWVDLGSGNNFYVDLLREHFRSAHGIDADPAYLASASRPDLLGNILRLPLKTASVSLLTSFMVIEHIENPDGFGGELERVLAPGGSFVFVTVNRGFWGSRLNSLLPEGLKKRLLGLLFGREEKDIFPAYYRLNTLRDLQAAFSGRFDLEIKEYRGYYGFSRPFFWAQHALSRAFKSSPLFVSNFLIVGKKRA